MLTMGLSGVPSLAPLREPVQSRRPRTLWPQLLYDLLGKRLLLEKEGVPWPRWGPWAKSKCVMFQMKSVELCEAGKIMFLLIWKATRLFFRNDLYCVI
jgi:hypothetical protein